MAPPSETTVVNFVKDKIIKNTEKGRVLSGGQYVVFIQEIWFPKQRYTQQDAGRIIFKAAKSLGLDPSDTFLGLKK